MRGRDGRQDKMAGADDLHHLFDAADLLAAGDVVQDDQ
jgi:hypothetical protein